MAKGKYKVYVTELRYGSVLIEADTEKEAEKIAKKCWENKEVEWHGNELTDICPEEVTSNV